LVIRDVANEVVDIDKNFDFFTAKEYLTDLGYYGYEDE
jgi:hypothetical protein